MIFTPIVLGHKLLTTATSSASNQTTKMTDTICDKLIEKGTDKIMDLIKAYGSNDPAVRNVVTPAVKNLVWDAIGSVNFLAKAQRVGITIGHGIAYFISLGNSRTLAVSLGLAICELMDIPVVMSGPIIGVFTRIITYEEGNQQNRTLSTEADEENEISGVLTALWQSVSIIFNIASAAPDSITSFFKISYSEIKSAAKTTQGLLKLFSLITKCIYKMYIWCMDKIYGINHSNNLLYHNRQLTTNWAKEVHILIDPLNEQKVMNSVLWYERLVMAMTVGKVLSAEMCKAKVKDTPPNFERLMNKLQDLYIKVINIGYSTSTRREPVCVWVSGAPGIGKTHMKDHMVLSFLKANKISHVGNPVYTHTSGTKHWTGVKAKQVVLFDDFSTVEGETLESDISDLMRLVSDARFCPDQAAVEDKGTPVAPALVYVNCNESHPSYNPVRDRGAFLRRRHVVIEARLTKEFLAKGYQNLESPGAREWVDGKKTDINPYPHLEFVFLDPMNCRSLDGVKSFPEFKKEFLRKTTNKYLLNDITYRQKLHEFEVSLGEEVDLPLEDVVRQIMERAENACQGVPLATTRAKLHAHFKKVYEVSERYAQRAAEVAREMVRKVVPKFGTEADEEGMCVCVCLPRDLLYAVKRRCMVDDRNGKVIRFCSEACTMRTQDFWDCVWTLPMMDAQKGRIQEAMKQLGVKFESEESEDDVAVVEQVIEELDQALADRAEPQEESMHVNIAVILLGLSGILVMGGGIYALYKFMKGDKSDIQGTPIQIKVPEGSLFNNDGPIKKTELVSSGDSSTSKVPRHKGIMMKHVVHKTEQVESEALAAFEDILDKNICYLVLEGVDKTTQLQLKPLPFRCLGLCERYIVALKHYIAKIRRTEDPTITFVNSSATVRTVIDMNKVKIHEYSSSEIVLIRLPLQVAQFKDIRRHVLTEADSSKITNKAKIYEKQIGNVGRVFNLVIQLQSDLEYYDNGVLHVAPQAISYKWHSPGRCMSPIYSNVGREVIIGFHICGGEGMGAGEPLVIETLLPQIESTYSTECLEDQYLDTRDNAYPMVVLTTELYPEGVASDKFAARPQSKSFIEPSLIHGYLPPKTRPAPLTPDDVDKEFSPLVSGVEKHGMPPKGFDKQLLARAQAFLREGYLQNCISVRPVDILTEQEAVIGIPGLDGYQAMELSTSEGFPYVASRPVGATNKRYQFTIEDLPDGSRKLVDIDASVRSIMSAKLRMRESCTIPPTVFIDCLKDARIPSEKFRVPGKTRIFSISPTDFTIQFRQYFGDLLAAQKVNRFSMEHMVGMNIHSLEWTKLGRLVQSKGPKVLCGDYSNFGPGLDPEVVSLVGEVWCDWYDDRELASGVEQQERDRRRRVRTCMIEEMRMAIHLCGNIFYRAPCGSPSGAPCTVNLNNDVNRMYIYMAWLNCWKDIPLMNSPVAFQKHCVMFVYGDDIIINVSDEASARFHNEYLHQFFANHNIRYTDASKGTTLVKWSTFEDASFLKAKWRPHPEHPGIFLPALDRVSVEDCANWVHKSPSAVEATHQAVCDSLMLAYGQGRDYFNQHRDRLLRAWRDSQDIQNLEGQALTLYTWEEMDDMRLGVVEPLLGGDFELAVARERKLREQLSCSRDYSATLMQLVTESCESDPAFVNALRRLRTRYEASRRQGVRVPALERILKQYLE